MNKKIKGAFKSKTVYVAFIAQDLVGVLLISNDFIKTQFSTEAFGWYLIALGMIQKLLRYLTTESLEQKGIKHEKTKSPAS